MGIAEADFWNMTLAELDRVMKSKQRLQKIEAQEKASYDYILADLIGRSISRIYSSSSKMPSIADAYPTLFNSQEIKEKEQEQKDNLYALRFRQFANSFNNRHKGVNKDNE